MITKFVERSLCLDDYLARCAKVRPLRILQLSRTESTEAVADRIESLLAKRS